jgi:hypothetical protein
MGGEPAGTFDFTAAVWLWSDGSWWFATVPEEVSDEIADAVPRSGPGFGAVAVTATVGSTTWQTSVFPSREHAAYLLPVKKSVRRAELLEDGRTASFRLTLR